MPLVSNEPPTDEALGLEPGTARERQASRTFGVLSEEAVVVPAQPVEAPPPVESRPIGESTTRITSLFGD